MEGIFHDAHEVYCKPSGDKPWQWCATLSTEDLADEVALMITENHDLVTEVRPV